ncbi:hypothetical protein RFI_03232 [Reticulomyxa filosa]|uniref:Uncharacterized protein n=1 Tax=Reticulomyxa filosa TaxID=46433 RepID=X6P6S4_RETFI|nr:hypothetical protein RFI_03232 [Reticulomyxa filosa]|eukprot:ETO33861.1 hypothetical protein RFI_03232 [Reticulomyxa filosa]
MISNIWAYLTLATQFLMEFVVALSVQIINDHEHPESNVHFQQLCKFAGPIRYVCIWIAFSAVLKYFLLRGLDLQLSLEGPSKQFITISLFTFYGVWGMEAVCLGIVPPFVPKPNGKGCASKLSSTFYSIAVAIFASWNFPIVLSVAIFLRPLWILRKAVNSMYVFFFCFLKSNKAINNRKIENNLANQHEKEMKKSVNFAILRTSMICAVTSLIFLVATALYYLRSTNATFIFLFFYSISFFAMAILINLSYHDCKQRCCPCLFLSDGLEDYLTSTAEKKATITKSPQTNNQSETVLAVATLS